MQSKCLLRKALKIKSSGFIFDLEITISMFSRATVAIWNHTCFAFSHASNDESGYQREYL